MCNLMYSLEEGTKAGEGKGDCFGGKNQNSEYCDKWEKLCGISIKDKSNTVYLSKSNAHMQDKECLAKNLPSRQGSESTKDGAYGEGNKDKRPRKYNRCRKGGGIGCAYST